jgi:hypothetical protein
MKFCFDLDGTLCNNTYGKYELAIPYKERVEKVNKLYDNGNEIFIESARGSSTGINWTEFTREQLISWGVKFHHLRTGIKYEADVYIDDRAILDKDFFKGD